MDDDRTLAFAEMSVAEGYERFLSGPLFEPWAALLRERVPLPAGATIVDVACGTGTLARPLARAVGPQGRVLAVDVRPGMLAMAMSKPEQRGTAPIAYLECSATALRVPDESADLVVCQQGIQFFPDRSAAIREMYRVLGPGGTVAVSTWAAEHPLGLFGPMAAALSECGVPEPFPRAFDPAGYTMTRSGLTGLLERGGFTGVTVDTQTLDAIWPSPEHVLATLAATAYAAAVDALPPPARERVHARLADRWNLPDSGPVSIRTSAHIARGRRPVDIGSSRSSNERTDP